MLCVPLMMIFSFFIKKHPHLLEPHLLVIPKQASVAPCGWHQPD